MNYRDSTYPRPSSWEENRFDPADFVILSEAGEKLGLYARTLKEALRTPMDELQVSISEYYPIQTIKCRDFVSLAGEILSIYFNGFLRFDIGNPNASDIEVLQHYSNKIQ